MEERARMNPTFLPVKKSSTGQIFIFVVVISFSPAHRNSRTTIPRDDFRKEKYRFGRINRKPAFKRSKYADCLLSNAAFGHFTLEALWTSLLFVEKHFYVPCPSLLLC